MFVSCETISFGNKINTGTISYEISYPDIPENSYMLDLYPSEMQTMFKNGKYRTDIIAGMGLFKTSIIFDEDEDYLVHSAKMLTKKMASELTYSQVRSFNPDFNNLDIEFLEETKEIAGYECKSALAKSLQDEGWYFKVYYTEKFGVEDPNRHGPFKDIKGVLMEYEILSYDTRMHFIATKVTTDEFEETELALEDDYKMVEPDILKKEIESIFKSVQ